MRLIALLILVIPGFLSVLGIKLLRDVLFQVQQNPFPYLWTQFAVGVIFLVFGIWFIAGFIRFRDRKNRKVVIKVSDQTEEPESN